MHTRFRSTIRGIYITFMQTDDSAYPVIRSDENPTRLADMWRVDFTEAE